MQAAVLLIKNGFPIAVPIAVGTNWPEFAPADNPAFVFWLMVEVPINHQPQLSLTHKEAAIKTQLLRIQGKEIDTRLSEPDRG